MSLLSSLNENGNFIIAPCSVKINYVWSECFAWQLSFFYIISVNVQLLVRYTMI